MVVEIKPIFSFTSLDIIELDVTREVGHAYRPRDNLGVIKCQCKLAADALAAMRRRVRTKETVNLES